MIQHIIHIFLINRIDNWVYGPGYIYVANPSTPVMVNPTRITEGYRQPPDGVPADFSLCDTYSSENYLAKGGSIRSDSSILYAAYFEFYKLSHPGSAVETIRTIGCWRGDYEGDGANTVAINETLEIVALGTGLGKIYFVDIDDVIDSNYSADPIATWDRDGMIQDLYWYDNILYVCTGGYVFVLDVSDVESGNIDTIGMYLTGGGRTIIADGDYIFLHVPDNHLFILEVDTTMQVGEDGCSFLDEEFRIFPNPIMQNSRIILSKKLNKPKLYNLAGKRMSLNDRTIDTSLLSPGIYFLSAEYNKKRITKKITVVN